MKNCHHHIKCITTTLLATLMGKRPLNSAILATATHKEMIRVSDRTGAQVGVWMINKYKVQMIEEDLYNIEESPKRGDEKRKKKRREYRSKILLYASMPMNKIFLHFHFCVLVFVILLSMYQTV